MKAYVHDEEEITTNDNVEHEMTSTNVFSTVMLNKYPPILRRCVPCLLT